MTAVRVRRAILPLDGALFRLTLDHPPRFEDARERAALAQLRDAQLDRPDPNRTSPVTPSARTYTMLRDSIRARGALRRERPFYGRAGIADILVLSAHLKMRPTAFSPWNARNVPSPGLVAYMMVERRTMSCSEQIDLRSQKNRSRRLAVMAQHWPCIGQAALTLSEGIDL